MRKRSELRLCPRERPAPLVQDHAGDQPPVGRGGVRSGMPPLAASSGTARVGGSPGGR